MPQAPTAQPLSTAQESIRIAQESIQQQIIGLQALEQSLDENFHQVVQLILQNQRSDKGRVILMGVGKSGHIAVKIAATLASTGTAAHFVHAGEASHGDLGMIAKHDIVIAISKSGESKELSDTCHYCRRFDIPLVAITADPQSSLARMATYILQLPRVPEACPLQLAPTTSTTMTLVLGDALAIALLKARGFHAQDFADFHPGGKLGAQLLQVQVLLDARSLPLPLAEQHTPLNQALIIMSQGMRGCIGLLDANARLCGIITDGDLRRFLEKQINLNTPCDQVMSKTPQTILNTALAAEALAILQQKKISSLFVTDEQQRIVGVINIHDLMAHGVV